MVGSACTEVDSIQEMELNDNAGIDFCKTASNQTINFGLNYFFSYFFQGGGMKEGDYIVGINEVDVKWSPHDEVVALIKSSGNTLKLKVVTPMDGKEKVRHPKKKKYREFSSQILSRN